VKSEKRVIQFRIEATMPSNLLLLWRRERKRRKSFSIWLSRMVPKRNFSEEFSPFFFGR
jgi:hypothetical protein